VTGKFTRAFKYMRIFLVKGRGTLDRNIRVEVFQILQFDIERRRKSQQGKD
jgi:hypothetical protein